MRGMAKESSKECRRGERLKHMTVVLDPTLSENGDFMAVFAAAMSSMKVEYQLSDSQEVGVVRWKSTEMERDVSESAEVVSRTVEVEEKEVLLTLEAQGFVGLVHHSKQVHSFVSLYSGP